MHRRFTDLARTEIGLFASQPQVDSLPLTLPTDSASTIGPSIGELASTVFHEAIFPQPPLIAFITMVELSRSERCAHFRWVFLHMSGKSLFFGSLCALLLAVKAHGVLE